MAFWIFEGVLLATVFILGRYLWNSKIEIPGVKELAAERDHYKSAVPHLLYACELVERWMLSGQPGPHSDSQVLEVVRNAIAKAREQTGAHP